MNTSLLFLNLGGSEVVLVLVAILILFGGKGVPNIARTLGKSIREFKDATNGIQRDIQNHASDIQRELNNHAREIEEQAKEANKDLNS